MMKALDCPDVKLLDNRDKEEWLGISSQQIIEEVLRSLNEVPAQRLARATGRLT